MAQNNLALELTESGYVPDLILRRGIRLLLKQRLNEIHQKDIEAASSDQQQFVNDMKSAPVALLPEKANEQHYEVPAEFFDYVMGEHNKYSCCKWERDTDELTDAESRALEETCEHAHINDGNEILELGCGWGSLTLYMAKKFPNSQITAVSNSSSQREYILEKANANGISNIEIITCDMNDFQIDKTFDRIVSVEMMEHMRNYQVLYGRISGWLKPEGKFFKHVFVHKTTPYAFEVKDETDWMSEHFFSGGMMPSDDLPLWFQDDLKIESRWRWNGQHYAKTADAWLKNMDNNRSHVIPVLEATYGIENTEKWWNRWRMFFMACSELFGYDKGQEWFVGHYLFSKK